MEVIDPSGCRIKDSLDIAVIDLTVNAGALEDKVCRFNTTDLFAQIDANSPYSTTWRDPLNAIISSQDSFTTTPLLNGHYQVQRARERLIVQT